MDNDSLEKVVEEILEWQAETFKKATQKSRATHLLREAAELYAAPGDVKEAADVIFLAIGLINGAGENLLTVLRQKLDVVKQRKYGEPDDEGVSEHIKTATGRFSVSEQNQSALPSISHIRMMLDGELPG